MTKVPCGDCDDRLLAGLSAQPQFLLAPEPTFPRPTKSPHLKRNDSEARPARDQPAEKDGRQPQDSCRAFARDLKARMSRLYGGAFCAGLHVGDA